MARIKGAMMTRKRRKKVLKLAKGYSDGWAAHKYRAYFGVWPRGLQDVCAEPSPEIYSFITSQNIRFAKRNDGGRRAA